MSTLVLLGIFKRLSRLYPVQTQTVRYIRRRPDVPAHIVPRTYDSSADDTDLFMEDAVEDDLQSATIGGMYQNREKRNEKKMHQEFVKRKIIERKEKKLYQPKEPLLLTWAARAQIKHLNKMEPDVWTPDVLAQSFPASREAIIKILKSHRIPQDEFEIFKNDRRVYNNWLRLKVAMDDCSEDGGPIDPTYRLLVEGERMSLMLNAAGISSLPIPKLKDILITQKEIAKKRKLKVKGEFSSILENYEKDRDSVKSTEKQSTGMRHIDIEDSSMMPLLKGISEPNYDESDTFEPDNNKSKHYLKVEEAVATSKRYTRIEQGAQDEKLNKNTSERNFKDELRGQPNKMSRRERRLNRDLGPQVEVNTANVDVFRMLKTGIKEGDQLTTLIDRTEHDSKSEVADYAEDELTITDADDLRFSKYKQTETRYSKDFQKRSNGRRDIEDDVDDASNYLSGTLDDIDLSDSKGAGGRKGRPYKVKQMGKEVYSPDGELLYRLPF